MAGCDCPSEMEVEKPNLSNPNQNRTGNEKMNFTNTDCVNQLKVLHFNSHVNSHVNGQVGWQVNWRVYCEVADQVKVVTQIKVIKIKIRQVNRNEFY